MLVDGAALYRAVRESFIKAQHSILILGWDIDSRTRLVGESGAADDGFPVPLAAFLSALVQRRPELTVRLLLWDFSMLYAFERELLPQLALDWSTPDQVQLCLDSEAPLGCSQHQKIIVVDDAVAYSGGLDLTIRRWDTPAHALDNPRRVDPAGEPYPPFHDVQALVDGDAARALAELARTRWCRAKKTDVAACPPGSDVWPDSVTPDFTDVQIGISRTEPRGRRAIREVENLFLDSIDAAERTIYIENQFLTSEAIAKRLADRMRRKSALETLIVAPNKPESWIEARTMRNGRIRFRSILEKADVGDRWRMVYPQVTSEGRTADTMIHSKVMVIDDRFLRVGSANLNHRSMGADTECDLAIEASDPATRQSILRIRNQLLAEHCGANARDVEAMLENTGSLIAVADHLSHERPLPAGDRRWRARYKRDRDDDRSGRRPGASAQSRRDVHVAVRTLGRLLLSRRHIDRGDRPHRSCRRLELFRRSRTIPIRKRCSASSRILRQAPSGRSSCLRYFSRAGWSLFRSPC